MMEMISLFNSVTNLISSLPPLSIHLSPLSYRYSECNTSKQCKMNVAYSRGCACFVSSTIHKFNPCRDPVNPLDEDEQCNGECPSDSCDGRKPECDVDEDTGVGTCDLSWGSTRRPLQCIEPLNQLKWMSHKEACEDQRGGMVVPYVCDSGNPSSGKVELS